jgi:methyl coenzyme M reductase beta subunit
MLTYMELNRHYPLKTWKGRIPGRELKLPIMQHKDSIIARIKDMVQLEEMMILIY